MQLATSLGVVLCALLSLVLFTVSLSFVRRIGRLRWELFYYDFILAAFVVAVVAGFTVGTFGAEITFRDNIAIVSYRQLAYAAAAGGIFAVGSILLVASIAVAGASVAGAMAGSAAIITSAIVTYFTFAGVSTGVQFAGVALALAVFVVTARFHAEVSALRKKDATHKTPMRKKVEMVSPGVVLALSLVSGIALGTFLLMVDWSRDFDLPMTAFPIAALFAFGLLGVGFVANLYFLNLPVQGDPLSPLAYFRMPAASHVPGLASGGLLAVALIAYLMLFDAPAGVAPPRGIMLAILPVAIGIFSVMGRAVWKEYDDGDYRIQTVFLGCGFGVIAAALALLAGYF